MGKWVLFHPSFMQILLPSEQRKGTLKTVSSFLFPDGSVSALISSPSMVSKHSVSFVLVRWLLPSLADFELGSPASQLWHNPVSEPCLDGQCPAPVLLAGAGAAGFSTVAFTVCFPFSMPCPTGVRSLTWRNKIVPLYKVGKVWGLDAPEKSTPFICSIALSCKEPDSFSSPVFCSCFKFCKMAPTFFPGHFNQYSLHSVELKGTFNYVSE